MKEFNSGFANIEGRMIGETVKVGQFAGRNPSPQWQVRCLKCNSNWRDSHYNLVNANGIYACKNVACRLGRVEAPRAKQNEAELDRPLDRPAPVPVPAPKKVSADYELYSRWMAQWGLGRDVASYSDWQRLSNEQRSRIMSPVIEAEKVELRKQELEAFGQGIELAERERIRLQYGEY
jgi:hypothetical protein